MKYFVTGSKGFIARHLIEELKKDPNNIVHSCGKIEPHVVDYLLDVSNPEIIFHLGAELKDNDKMFESNVMLTMKIIEYCAKRRPKLLVLFGSSSEYGYSTKVMAEDDLPNPQTLYAGTKAATAMLAKVWSQQYDIPILYVRPFTVYGEDEKSTKLTQILFQKWKENGVLQLSEGVHDYIYIDDFIDILLKHLVRNHIQKFDIVNLGSGVETTNFQFVREFEKVVGHTFKIELKDAKRETEFWCADTKKLQWRYVVSELEMRKVRDLSNGIKRMVYKYVTNGA
jgi:nucleoside-diphosphate-sugar epimerase